MPGERIIAYIDNAYVFSGMLAAGWRFSWTKLSAKLAAEHPIWESYFFAAEHIPPKDSQRNFFNALAHELGYTVVLRPTRPRHIRCEHCGESKLIFNDQSADMALVTTLLIHLRNGAFDTALLMTGDGDLAPALAEVKRTGRRVEIVGWRNSVSRELEELSSRRPLWFLDDWRAQIEKDSEHQL